MRKRISPFKLHRETLRLLDAAETRAARAGAGESDGDSCVLSCPPNNCQAGKAGGFGQR